MAKYLDYGGLQTTWVRIKSWVKSYVKFFVNKYLGGGTPTVTPVTNLSTTPSTNIPGTSDSIYIGYGDGMSGNPFPLPIGYTIRIEADTDHSTAKVYIVRKEGNNLTALLAEGSGSAEYLNNTNSNETVVVGAEDYRVSITAYIYKSAADRLDEMEQAIGQVAAQNSFGNVKVGDTTVSAESPEDTLELVAGTNVTLTPDVTNDKVTISSADTKNTAGSTADANKLFIIGAKSQAANPQTYSQANAYITGGKVYSNAKETVNLSDSQTLTNKTINGGTLSGTISGSPTLSGTVAFTGSPTLSTAAASFSADNQITNKGYVDTAIASAISGKIKYEKYDSYDDLPALGSEGTIYLVANGGVRYDWIDTVTDGSSNPHRSENPKASGWYEFSAVASPSGNPKSLGYCERSGDSSPYTYTLTEDTTVQSGKTYYQATVSNDTTVNVAKSYYRKMEFCDEYIWIDSEKGYEMLGPAAIDIGSITTEEIQEIVEDEYIAPQST